MADSLADALVRLHADLPHVPKKAQSHHGKYADLADLSKIVLPRLAALGLVFTARPTLHFGEPGDVKFVLAYELLHAASGESRQGFYPLGTGNPQQLGSAITYARRYCLCAVTGVAPDEDDDDAQAAAEYQPETRADGSATEAEQMRMQRGHVPGVQRSNGTPPDDMFYDQPRTDRTPREELPGTAAPAQLRKMHALFKNLGIDDRDERLQATREIVGRDVQSANALSFVDAQALNSALEERVKEAAVPGD